MDKNINDYNNAELLVLHGQLIDGLETLKLAKASDDQFQHVLDKIKQVEKIIETRMKVIVTKENATEVEATEIPKHKLSPTTHKAQPQPISLSGKSQSTIVQRLKKNKPFLQTSDTKKFNSLIRIILEQLRAYSKHKNRETVKKKYLKLVTDSTNTCIEFVKKRAEKEWVEFLLKEKSYSCGYEKKRFSLDLEKTLKEFSLK